MAEDPLLSTPDEISNHPALRGLKLCVSASLAVPLSTLTTKTMLVAGEGGVHTNEAGRCGAAARLRQADREDVGAVEMPEQADRLTHGLRDR